MKPLLQRTIMGYSPVSSRGLHEDGQERRAAAQGQESGVTIWSKIRFVVDFRNLLFARDFDLSFSKGYSLMKFFNM
jgi:hypothetical protein